MLIDVNVSLGRWPFQRFVPATPKKLAEHLKAEGISSAFVSAIEAVFYPDPDVYNKLLRRRLGPHSNLMPVIVVNPALANWREALKVHLGSPQVKAVKIVPNYHNYSLARRSAAELMDELTARKIPLLIQMRIEDERNQYPLLKVAGVDYKGIIKLANRFQGLPIICLCPYFREAIPLVKETTNIYVDISFVEKLDTVASLLKEIKSERVLFGSHTPFLYTRSAVMKIKEARIAKRDFNALAFRNACRLLNMKRRKK